ncbi:unnamed protein product [Agarophyton chilense]
MVKNMCLVCNEQHAKYKCPTCRLPFCSVPCSKSHKQNCAPLPLVTAPRLKVVDEQKAKRQQEEESLPVDLLLLKTEQLRSLENDREVQRKLRDDRLLEILQHIDSSSNRVKTLEMRMKDPAFLEFCDDVLKALGCKLLPDAPLTLEETLRLKLESLKSKHD